MDQSREIIKWQGLDIEVRYNPDYAKVYCAIFGYSLAHLEIESVNREKLPITETGYRSHFERADNVAAEGGAAAYVLAWLDHAAKSPEWRELQELERQYALF